MNFDSYENLIYEHGGEKTVLASQYRIGQNITAPLKVIKIITTKNYGFVAKETIIVLDVGHDNLFLDIRDGDWLLLTMSGKWGISNDSNFHETFRKIQENRKEVNDG